MMGGGHTTTQTHSSALSTHAAALAALPSTVTNVGGGCSGGGGTGGNIGCDRTTSSSSLSASSIQQGSGGGSGGRPSTPTHLLRQHSHQHHSQMPLLPEMPPMPTLPLPHTEGQTYCLRWNNHKSNLVEILDALIKVESYVDCTLVVDEQVQFKAHRVILAANSPYFQTILQDVPMDHCSIIVPGVKPFEMRALLEYMYTGEVNVTQRQIPRIMRIAEQLEVKGLFDMTDLKEKFNTMGDEGGTNSSATTSPYGEISSGACGPVSSSNLGAGTTTGNSNTHSHALNGTGAGKPDDLHHLGHHSGLSGVGGAASSSNVITTSPNSGTTAMPASSSRDAAASPPYIAYKSPYSSIYAPKSPGLHSNSGNIGVERQSNAGVAGNETQSSSSNTVDRGAAPQWPLSPSTAVAMLSSVYESAPDMNPLKRKKISSITSMLMHRDTPILRNVLAQANSADSPSQGMPLLLPGSTSGSGKSGEKSSSSSSLASLVGVGGSSGSADKTGSGSAHNNNHGFNGADYVDKKYHMNDEPHSPYTDRSFDDDSYEPKGNYGPSSGGPGGGAFGVTSGGSGGGSGSGSHQKPEWKRYKQYTRSDIMSAIQCVREGMSALQASRKFGVPSRTLYDKVKKLGITTGRPMNRTMKRSPSSVESSAAFPYSQGYGSQHEASSLLSALHEGRGGGGSGGGAIGDDHEMKEHSSSAVAAASLHHSLSMSHPAAAFLQQALENRGGDIAGRDALHAMALAAAAHAAANQINPGPGPNSNGPLMDRSGGGAGAVGNPSGGRRRSTSPSASFVAATRDHVAELLLEQQEKDRRILERVNAVAAVAAAAERDIKMEHSHERERVRDREREREREHERDHHNDADDEEDDHVEDLSVSRKEDISMSSPEMQRIHPESPYSPIPPQSQAPLALPPSISVIDRLERENGPASGVIVPPLNEKKLMLNTNRSVGSPASSVSGDDEYDPTSNADTDVAKNDQSVKSNPTDGNPTASVGDSAGSASLNLNTPLKRETLSDDGRAD